MRLEPRPPISAEARGMLRAIWTRSSADADTIESAARRVPCQVLRDTRLGFGRRADHAVETIMQAMPVPPLVRERRSAAWRFLKPRAEPVALQVVVLVLNLPGCPGLHAMPFGFSASTHALGRLLDRTRFQADPAEAVIQAHDALLALDPIEFARLMDLRGFQLPSVGGVFLASPDTTTERQPAIVARTWVDSDQLFDDQKRHADAWSRLLRPIPSGNSGTRTGTNSISSGADQV